jgi:hypothetical protein
MIDQQTTLAVVRGDRVVADYLCDVGMGSADIVGMNPSLVVGREEGFWMMAKQDEHSSILQIRLMLLLLMMMMMMMMRRRRRRIVIMMKTMMMMTQLCEEPYH